MSIKVMLTDDHDLVREGVKCLLESDSHIKVIGEAKDGVECLDTLETLKPDIVILDINMPNMNGVETLGKIKSEYENMKVLILTMHDEIEYLIRTMDLGANGYILKKSKSNDLINAVNAVMHGQKYIYPDLEKDMNKVIDNRNHDLDKCKSLTKRETEILIQVAEGMFNKEIAINLDISERTVKNHISNMFKKIDVSDRTQAAVFAIKSNIVKLY